MLGVRLKPDEEERLARHARGVGRAKSAIARDWIVERLDRESDDVVIARAAALIAAHEHEREPGSSGIASWMLALDAEDGGYDWGPEGPPV